MKKDLLIWIIFIFTAVSVAAFLIIQTSMYSSDQVIESVLASANPIKLSNTTPQFSDYPVNEIFVGTPLDVDLSSNPKIDNWNSLWKKLLKERSRGNPTFAGHYTVVELGCGTSCQVIAVVDVETGKLYLSDFAASLGTDFRKDSNLIVVNPSERIREFLAGTGYDSVDWLSTEYYKWENNQFILVATNPRKASQGLQDLYINPPFDSAWDYEFCYGWKNTPEPSEDEKELRKIISTDPTTLTKKEFNNASIQLVSHFSGSGGYFLCEQEIEWIKRGYEYFEELGQVSQKEKYAIFKIFAIAYESHRQYQKALEYYKIINDEFGIEATEWLIKNTNKRYGDVLELKEYDGEVSCGGATVQAELEAENYKFTRCFKGPTFIYNKLTDKHMLIFNPVVEIDKYPGIHSFSWDGRYADIYYGIFDIQTNQILRSIN